MRRKISSPLAVLFLLYHVFSINISKRVLCKLLGLCFKKKLFKRAHFLSFKNRNYPESLSIVVCVGDKSIDFEKHQ